MSYFKEISMLLVTLLFVSCNSAPPVPEEAKHYPLVKVRLEGKMFHWDITHAGADGALDTADDIKTKNLVVVPERHRVLWELSSLDVIHGFFLPSFDLRRPLLPQKNQQAEIVVMKPGQYRFACSEVCGVGHGKMLGFLQVLPQQDYQAWQVAQIKKRANLTLVQPHDTSPAVLSSPLK